MLNLKHMIVIIVSKMDENIVGRWVFWAEKESLWQGYGVKTRQFWYDKGDLPSS